MTNSDNLNYGKKMALCTLFCKESLSDMKLERCNFGEPRL